MVHVIIDVIIDDAILSNQASRHKLDLKYLKLQLLNEAKLGSDWEIKPEKWLESLGLTLGW